ncbi:Hypothetical predicted protein [Podarcis lilfordi]|uniref:Uncharacterized protein n=1 Tax=Podarcis lilfordi TaxID=74358 RepID=A0AA35NUS1_9SAUR|nr:Hypothetical predicted protein [Podarcis lilfordi]
MCRQQPTVEMDFYSPYGDPWLLFLDLESLKSQLFHFPACVALSPEEKSMRIASYHSAKTTRGHSGC